MTLRLGISAVPTSPAAIDYVVEADRLGVDSVWVPEFWGYDALTPLGALAMRTKHIRLGTGIAHLGGGAGRGAHALPHPPAAHAGGGERQWKQRDSLPEP